MYLTIKEITSDILETQARLEQKHYLIKLRNKHHQNIINLRCKTKNKIKKYIKDHLKNTK